IAADEHRVVHVAHAGQHVPIGNQRGTNRDTDGRAVGGLPPPALNWWNGLDRGEEFDGVAELPRELDVQRCDLANAFDMDVADIDPEAVRQRGEDPGLVK